MSENDFNMDKHSIGDPYCNGCFGGWPEKCKCGGLIHSQFWDYGAGWEPLVKHKCDSCGYDFEWDE